MTSALADRLNTNTQIRTFVHEALTELVVAGQVRSCPLELSFGEIARFAPDLVLALGSVASDTSDLRRLRQAADKAGAMLAFWLHDDPYEFDYAFKVEAVADIIFTNDAWSARHYRHDNVHHLPLGGSPRAQFRQVLPSAEREFACFFCGVAYPNRVRLVRGADDILCQYPVAVLGAEWPPDIRCARNRRLTPSEMADYAQRSRLTLNIGRDLDIANRRFALPPTTPGPRTFEVAMSGSTQLYMTSGLEITKYFEPNSEILLIDEIRDIRLAIERSYDAPEEIDEIARRAQERAIREHSYAARMAQLLSLCEPNIRTDQRCDA